MPGVASLRAGGNELVQTYPALWVVGYCVLDTQLLGMVFLPVLVVQLYLVSLVVGYLSKP